MWRTIRSKKDFWLQIANHWADVGADLMLAIANEPHVEYEASMKVLLSYHQKFIDHVSSTGTPLVLAELFPRQKYFLVLVVQCPKTDVYKTKKLMLQMPTDTAPVRLMSEGHFYSPYQFSQMV